MMNGGTPFGEEIEMPTIRLPNDDEVPEAARELVKRIDRKSVV